MANTVSGGTGADLLQGQVLSGLNNDIIGFQGNDTLIAATIADTLQGGQGADSLSFGTGLTVNGAEAIGGRGNDSFFINGTTVLASQYQGNNGTDLFNFTAATNLSSVSVRGGEGADTITVLTNAVVTTNGFVATLGQGADVFTVGTGSVATTMGVWGGKDNDTLTINGTYQSSSVGGNEGADRFFTSNNITVTNTILGLGKGHDLITTTAGGFLLSTVGTVAGGLGADTLTLQLSALSNFQIWGDGGDSTVGLGDVVALSAQGATAGTYGSVYGGGGNDTISFAGTTAGVQTAQAISYFGGSNADSITIGAGGASTVNGGDGHDTLIANYTLTGGGIFSATTMNGGAGIDQYAFVTTARTNFQIGTAISGIFGNTVLQDFTDAGDNILLQGISTSTATLSAINALNTGASTFAAQATTGLSNVANITGSFVYNLTGGFSAVAESGFGIGDINIFETGGDTVIQLLAQTTGTTGFRSFGGGITANSTGMKLTFILSGQLGIIDNATAGYLTGVGLTFGIASDAALGRNGFTITLA